MTYDTLFFPVAFTVATLALLLFLALIRETRAAPYRVRATMRAQGVLVIAAIAGLALGITWAILG